MATFASLVNTFWPNDSFADLGKDTYETMLKCWYGWFVPNSSWTSCKCWLELRTNWATKANLLLFKLFYLAVSNPICFKNVKVLSKGSGNGIISIIGNNKMTKSLRANTLLRLWFGHKMESFGLVRQSELQLLQKKLNKLVCKVQSAEIPWINNSWKPLFTERSCQFSAVSITRWAEAKKWW